MPLPNSVNVRLTDPEREQLSRLAELFPDPLGRPLSLSDVLRLALSELAARYLAGRAPGKKKKPGNSP